MYFGIRRILSFDLEYFYFYSPIEEYPLFYKKTKLLDFWSKILIFCTSIHQNWTKMAGEFLNALSAPPSVRYNMFIETLPGDEITF